ncbi:TPA: hypothetical protein DF272_01845 [Candidatus Falkowbacteria bacterium]|nr:hypothetical protein [Candidatus Falkowbacteria bacterium]
MNPKSPIRIHRENFREVIMDLTFISETSKGLLISAVNSYLNHVYPKICYAAHFLTLVAEMLDHQLVFEGQPLVVVITDSHHCRVLEDKPRNEFKTRFPLYFTTANQQLIVYEILLTTGEIIKANADYHREDGQTNPAWFRAETKDLIPTDKVFGWREPLI